MRPFTDFIDRWGLLDKLIGPDGGDTCHREYLFFSLMAMAHEEIQAENRFEEVNRKLHVSPGVLVRHSNPEYDASDWDRMSRDQMQPAIIAMGYYSKKELRKLALGHLQRGFLFTNNTRQNGATKRNHGEKNYSYAWKFPDLTLFEIWGNFIRSFNAWYLYPLLLVFDLELLGGAIKWRFWPKHNITLNHTVSQLQALDRLPTPLSFLAVKIMPIEKLVLLAEEHLTDFHPTDDMKFFGQMYRDAYSRIKQKHREFVNKRINSIKNLYKYER